MAHHQAARPWPTRLLPQLQVTCDRGGLRARRFVVAAPGLHRVRGRRQRRARPRRWRATTSSTRWRRRGRTRPCVRRSLQRRDCGVAEIAGSIRVWRQAGRRSRRSAHRRRLAHPGLGQEPDHGLLRRAPSSASRRWRTRPSWCSPTATTSTTSSSAPSHAARTCCASRRPRRRAAPTCAPSYR